MSNTVVVASYLSCAAAYLTLVLLLSASWQRQRIGAWLILAAGITAAWAAFLAFEAWWRTAAASWLFVADAVRYGAWFAFLTALLENRGAPPWLHRTNRGAHGLWIALALYGVFVSVTPRGTVPISYAVVIPVVGVLLLALCGLLLLEQLYRNVEGAMRWSLKFLVLALGTIFAYDIFMYSYAALYAHIDASTWTARGFINALVMPFFLVAAARNKRWAVPVGVSRKAVFYSSSLLIVTLYIFAAAVGGYLVRLYGGDWGTVAEITLLCFALLLLVVLALSGQMRARLRIFLYKNFFSYRHDYREEWLRLTGTLSAGDGSLTLRAVKAMARIMDSPAGVLFMRDEAGDFVPREAWNMPVGTDVRVSGTGPLFAFMRERQWIFDFTGGPPNGDQGLVAPTVIADLPQAWLMVPLLVEQELIGFIVLAHARARQTLNWEGIDLLRTAGQQTASMLAQAENGARLAEAKQFEGFNRLTSFMMHDLKNLVAQQALMLKNAERHKHNPAFIDDMLETTANAVERANRILAQLKGGEAVPLMQNRVALKRVIEYAIATCRANEPLPRLKPGSADVFVRADTERLASVIGHLIRNAQEATEKTGSVEVALQQTGGQAVIEIRDNGKGMEAEFVRTQLFRPFVTTKGSKGMGIGVYQAREYVQSLGGRMQVDSSPGQGTTVRLTLVADQVGDAGTEMAV